MDSKEVSLDSAVGKLAEILAEMCRPRLFFDISPRENNPNLLDIVLSNSGWTAAFHINCIFDPDIPYYENTMLSEVGVLKNLPFLEPHRSIRFFFKDLPSIIETGQAYGPKQTNVTINYENSSGHEFSEKYLVDLEKYKGILSVDLPSLKDQVNEIRYIRKALERIQNKGLITKTLEEAEEERLAWKKKYIDSKGNTTTEAQQD